MFCYFFVFTHHSLDIYVNTNYNLTKLINKRTKATLTKCHFFRRAN